MCGSEQATIPKTRPSSSLANRCEKRVTISRFSARITYPKSIMHEPRHKAGIDVVPFPFLVAKILKVLNVSRISLTWLVEPWAHSPKLDSFIKTCNKVFGTSFRIGSFWDVSQRVWSSPSRSKHVHHRRRLDKQAWLHSHF